MSISRRSLLNYIGLVILVVGMGIGELIYWSGLRRGSGPGMEDPLVSTYDSRVYERTVGMYGGTLALVIDRWSRAIASLAEPKPLAITIGVISIMAAAGCFIAAAKK